MTRVSHLSFAALAAAALLATSLATSLATVPACAQGTEEQQDACAPDAFKFCQKTIPDIPKTTACMKANFAQLSPRCQRAFGDVTGGDSKGAPAGVAGAAPAPPPPAAAVPDDSYSAQIRSYCRQGLIDPYTCKNTLSLLKGGE